MGLGKSVLVDEAEPASPIGRWYAHLFFMAKRKCLMFTHVKTYYTFVVYDLSREQIRGLIQVFRYYLGKQLYDDGFSPQAIKKALAEAESVAYAKAVDRKVISTMSQMIYEFDFYKYDGEAVIPQRLKKAGDALNHGIRGGNNNFIRPIEEFQPLLEDTMPITKDQAKEIARNHPSERKLKIDWVVSELPERFRDQLNMITEPCWYVSYYLADGPMRRKQGGYICVSRATGKVEYAGDVFDERKK
jgi:hypothetical protein